MQDKASIPGSSHRFRPDWERLGSELTNHQVLNMPVRHFIPDMRELRPKPSVIGKPRNIGLILKNTTQKKNEEVTFVEKTYQP